MLGSVSRYWIYCQGRKEVAMTTHRVIVSNLTFNCELFSVIIRLCWCKINMKRIRTIRVDTWVYLALCKSGVTLWQK